MNALKRLFKWLISPPYTPIKFAAYVVILIVVIIFVTKFFQLLEYNESGYTQVKQAWWSGNLSVRYTPGTYWQGLGKIYTFKKEETYKFTDDEKEKDADTPGMKIRFADGGECTIWGNVRYRVPEDDEHMIQLIRLFMGESGHPERDFFVEGIQQLIRKSIITTGALITTEQSYTTHRAQFSQIAWDQAINGIYEIETKEERTLDKESKTWVIDRQPIIKEDENGIVREPSYLKELGVSITQFVINDLRYPPEILELITKSRDFQTKIQTAEADADKAQQEKLTAEDTGKRDVTEAEYKAREIKITAVAAADKDKSKAIVNANRELEVAKQDYQAAVDNVTGMKALAVGMASRRKEVLAADGALNTKKDAYQKIMGFWGEAFKKLELVPDVAVSNEKNTQTPPMLDLLNSVDERVRKDLGLQWTFPR